MTARLSLVLLGEVLLLSSPAFAQRSARPHPDNDREEAKTWQPDVAARAAGDISGDRNDGELEAGGRGRMIYTRHGAIFTNDFDASNRSSGWNYGRKVGSGSCHESPAQAKKDGCPRSLRRWLLGRLLKRKGLKHHPPAIPRGPDW